MNDSPLTVVYYCQGRFLFPRKKIMHTNEHGRYHKKMHDRDNSSETLKGAGL